MSFLWRQERREVTFQDVWGAGAESSSSGAEALTALFAARRTIIDTVSSLPLHAYRTLADGTSQRVDREPDLIRPLHGSPYSWKAQIVTSMVDDGNAFGIATGMRSGWPTGIRWVRPDDVQVDEDNVVLPEYFYMGRHVPREFMVHIPWVVPAGKWRGISPLKAFKVAFETGVRAQEWGRDWFENGTTPPVHFKNTARELSAAAADDVKAKYLSAVRRRKPLVTGNDWDVNAIGTPADEQRVIASLKMTAAQVAAIYGLSPEDIGGEAANSLTYATVEGNERKQASKVGRPWCMRIEEALSMFTPRPQYLRFNLDANVRADLKTRMEAHEIALRTGLETISEARALEEKPPLTDAELAQWLTLYRPGSNPAQGTPATREQHA